MSKRRLVGCAIFASLAAGATGCAHGASAEEEKAKAERVQTLESRVKELEKTNGRISVRIDEMEDEIFLLQDRVEAHRLALKRRGFMRERTGDRARAEAPEPTPQTNYGRGRNRVRSRQQNNRGRYRVRGRGGHSPRGGSDSSADHPVTRIPLNRQQSRGRTRQQAQRSVETKGSRRRPNGRESEETVVITDEDFQEFARGVDGGGQGGGTSDRGSSGGGSGGEAKEPVTDEKLPTTDDEPSTRADSSAERTAEAPAPDLEEAPFSDKTGLDLYKTALAKYRSGEYATALEGFERFVSNGPRKDYRDNGLYWVGECQYGLGNFKKAIEYFQRVLHEEPGGNKVPDAMLKMALAYQELGMQKRARNTLEKLTNRYPSTNAGRLGEKKLSELNS